MKKFKFLLWLNLGLLWLPYISVAQVITSNPSFPLDTDNITITFNASEGNKGLANFTGDVYAHTGVITDSSKSSSDWKYVKTNWGVNTAETKLTRTSSNSYKLTIGNPRLYYGVPQSEKILNLAFVFRNTDGSKVGKEVGDKDIFQEIYDATVNVTFAQPNGTYKLVNQNEEVEFLGLGNSPDMESLKLELWRNDEKLLETQNDSIKYSYTTTEYGKQVFKLIGTDNSITSDTTIFNLIVNAPSIEEARPSGIIDGINKQSSSSVILSLYAPYKEYVYVVGDFNNWEVDPAYQMKKYQVNNDSVHFWLEINHLDSKTEYAFQYLIDGSIYTADPYSEKILDPWNDQWINEKYLAYPNLKPFPTGKAESPVTVFQIEEDEYNWKVENFEKPDKNAFVFYELLVRDFASVPTYRTLIDTLDYLKRLGVNAIKLMPIAEYDGNDSWGYNPAFHMALDKYYGTKNDLKELIDSCHVNGIAVVLDVVFNHATGQSPLVRMYSDANGVPSSTSIYAFPSARHPYNVFNDLNHGSSATNYWFKRVLKFWIEEYKIDGYRFDLSKGHYIGNTSDVGVWSSYNQWRIDHWKDNFNYLKGIDPKFLVILEHLGDNSEETFLANHGLLMWGKMTESYNEATMGWNENGKSDFKNAYYKSRNWNHANLVSYMESHDEERLMYKNILYGNSTNTSHNVKSLSVATERMKTAGAFFFTIPGPKMMWMFGELGYDVSINQRVVGGTVSNDNRTIRKPILWDYYNDPDRNSLYKAFGDLIKLRTKNPVFYDETTTVSMFTSGSLKRMELHHNTNIVNIVGNFDVTEKNMNFYFPETGKWYDYFGNDSLDVTNTSEEYLLQPGEFRIYSKVKFEQVPSTLVTSNEKKSDSNLPKTFELNSIYPNPFNPATTIQYSMSLTTNLTIDVIDIMGRNIATLHRGVQVAGVHNLNWDASKVASGIYLIRMQAGSQALIRKVTLIK